MAEHFQTRGKPVGHGFTAANLGSGQGNRSFNPKTGLRFIVLDTINERGNADGNIDHEQFKWIHQQLLEAERRHELAIAFAHHSLRTMNQPAASPFPPGDTGGNASPLVHFGLGPNGTEAPYRLLSAEAAPSLDETLRCLFLRHPSLIAFVDGHEHLNRIVPYARATTGSPRGGSGRFPRRPTSTGRSNRACSTCSTTATARCPCSQQFSTTPRSCAAWCRGGHWSTRASPTWRASHGNY